MSLTLRIMVALAFLAGFHVLVVGLAVLLLLVPYFLWTRHGVFDTRVDHDVDDELAAPTTSPYDTHPPLRDRLAALGDDGADAPEEGAPRAITLLDDVATLEVSAVAHITGAPLPVVRKLAPFAWDALGTQLVLPRWRAKVQEHAAVLAGTTPEQLAAKATRLEEVGQRFGRRDKVKALSPTGARRAALVAYGAALGSALAHAGWTVQAEPGGRPRLVRDGESLDPAELLEQLEAGALTAKTWSMTCAKAGIAGADLGALALQPNEGGPARARGPGS